MYNREKRKTLDKRIKLLIKLGCDREQAKAITYSRRSYLNISMFISIFITNKRLKQKGELVNKKQTIT